MNAKASALALPHEMPPLIRLRYLWWVAASIIILVASIRLQHLWFLNFVHVFTGVLWTGIDLFMGFVVGPILRKMDLDTRRAFLTRLMPRMLFLMPTLAMVTTTAGWYMASQLGFFSLGFPEFWWVVAALAIVSILTVQGIGILLPVNLRILFEFKKDAPDTDRIGRWMRTYVRVVASQGVMQVGIVVIMSKFATGL